MLRVLYPNVKTSRPDRPLCKWYGQFSRPGSTRSSNNTFWKWYRSNFEGIHMTAKLPVLHIGVSGLRTDSALR